ncbi:hypothetical protein F4815DRAFT_484982 [Daldinia loculata]|nr:hypothetical protein F4815DRAFT_484982 [Daldinia loculata]
MSAFTVGLDVFFLFFFPSSTNRIEFYAEHAEQFSNLFHPAGKGLSPTSFGAFFFLIFSFKLVRLDAAWWLVRENTSFFFFFFSSAAHILFVGNAICALFDRIISGLTVGVFAA